MAERIIVIDDDPSILALVTHHLGKEGLNTDAFPDADSGLSALEKEGYDVAIIDLYMPGITGFELLEIFAKNYPTTVCMVLSGTTLFDDAVQAMERGAYDFCSKPVEPKILVRKVRRALEHKRLQDRNKQLVDEIQGTNIELENRLSQLELAHRLLQSQAVALQSDLRQARSIQQRLLPHELPCWEQLSMAAFFHPANEVGGDFFDVCPLDDGRLVLYLADTAGHGVGSALVTVFLKHWFRYTMLENAGKHDGDPGKMLRHLNSALIRDPLGKNLFVSMALLVIDLEAMTMAYSTAGHPPLLWRRGEEALRHLRLSAPALGVNPSVKYGSSEETLKSGDLFALYTDGITDQMNPSDESYGLAPLEAIVANGNGDAPEALVARVESDLERFRKSRAFQDDCTVLMIEVAPQVSPHIPISLDTTNAPPEDAIIGSLITCASEKAWTFVSIRGRGTWQQSRQVSESVVQARETGQRVVFLDFEHCTYLDSTFMGVLHTLCVDAEAREEFEIRLQSLPRCILKLLSELGLTKVMLAFHPRAVPLPPEMAHLEGAAMSRTEMSRILLGAHEALVEADEQNSDKFAAVLEVLQREVDQH
jgi:phosphoserine phosphatase RsbU/P